MVVASVFKVGGKMFALSALERTPLQVSDGSLPEQLVRDMIEDSYDRVVSSMPARVREQLGWNPEREEPESAAPGSERSVKS